METEDVLIHLWFCLLQIILVGVSKVKNVSYHVFAITKLLRIHIEFTSSIRDIS